MSDVIKNVDVIKQLENLALENVEIVDLTKKLKNIRALRLINVVNIRCGNNRETCWKDGINNRLKNLEELTINFDEEIYIKELNNVVYYTNKLSKELGEEIEYEKTILQELGDMKNLGEGEAADKIERLRNQYLISRRKEGISKRKYEEDEKICRKLTKRTCKKNKRCKTKTSWGRSSCVPRREKPKFTMTERVKRKLSKTYKNVKRRYHIATGQDQHIEERISRQARKDKQRISQTEVAAPVIVADPVAVEPVVATQVEEVPVVTTQVEEDPVAADTQVAVAAQQPTTATQQPTTATSPAGAAITEDRLTAEVNRFEAELKRFEAKHGQGQVGGGRKEDLDGIKTIIDNIELIARYSLELKGKPYKESKVHQDEAQMKENNFCKKLDKEECKTENKRCKYSPSFIPKVKGKCRSKKRNKAVKEIKSGPQHFDDVIEFPGGGYKSRKKYKKRKYSKYR